MDSGNDVSAAALDLEVVMRLVVRHLINISNVMSVMALDLAVVSTLVVHTCNVESSSSVTIGSKVLN